MGLYGVSDLVGQEAETADKLDPKMYADALFELHRKHNEIVIRNFDREVGFTASFGQGL